MRVVSGTYSHSAPSVPLWQKFIMLDALSGFVRLRQLISAVRASSFSWSLCTSIEALYE